MGCATLGELRAHLDGELATAEGTRLEQHLAGCPDCKAALESLRANASLVGSAFARMAPPVVGQTRPAWSHIRDRAEGRSGRPATFEGRVSDVFRGLFGFTGGRRMRMATGAAAALVAVALLFTQTPVQTAASSFLSIFRVKKFVAVTVDPASLPNLTSPGNLGTFTTAGDKTPRSVANPAEAEKTVGFKVSTPAQLPSGLEAQPRSTMVVGAFNTTFTPDLKKVRAYLSNIGASDVKLPDNLDGAPITLQVSPSVAVLYTEKGGLDRQPDGSVKALVGQRFLYLGETTSPTMNVPSGLDVEAIRSELLKVPGLPPDLVNQVTAIDDWRNTVVVPVVKGKSRDVTVQGEKGLLISENGGTGATLMWLKGGVVYTLTGNVSEAEILAAANSMR